VGHEFRRGCVGLLPGVEGPAVGEDGQHAGPGAAGEGGVDEDEGEVLPERVLDVDGLD